MHISACTIPGPGVSQLKMLGMIVEIVEKHP